MAEAVRVRLSAQMINQVQPLDTWDMFRARLMKQGVKEPPRAQGTPAYCSAGK